MYSVVVSPQLLNSESRRVNHYLLIRGMILNEDPWMKFLPSYWFTKGLINCAREKFRRELLGFSSSCELCDCLRRANYYGQPLYP